MVTYLYIVQQRSYLYYGKNTFWSFLYLRPLICFFHYLISIIKAKRSRRWVILKIRVLVNLCQKLLFLHQLTNNMTTDWSLNYKKNISSAHVVYTNCFGCQKNKQFAYTTCSESILTLQFLCTELVIQWTIWFHIVG